MAEANLLTATTYDAAGRVLTRTQQATNDADGSQGFSATLVGAARTWNYTYNIQGQLISIREPGGATTSYTYYQDNDVCTGCRGQIQSITNALGHTTTHNAYDALGRLLETVDANGVKTKFNYDWRGNLLSRTDAVDTANAHTTTYQTFTDPDDVSRTIKRTTYSDGSALDYHFDAADRLIALKDSEGNTIEYTLDAMGNRIAEHTYDAQGKLHRAARRAVNAFGALIGQRDADDNLTRYAYDNIGNLTRITDPLDRVTAYQYDPRNRLTQTTDALGGIIKYAYDRQDRITEVTDPRGLVTRYTYNGFGDLISQISPDSGTTTYQYDAAGQLTSSTDAQGRTTTYTYDNLNRLIQSQTGALTTAYQYDQGTNALGRLTQISDPTGVTQYAYDPRGNVTEKRQTIANRAFTVGYRYQAGRLSQIDYPSGATIEYHYAHGRPSAVTVNQTPLMTNIRHEPFGLPSGWIWGNGKTHERTYDQNGRLKSLNLPNIPPTRNRFAYDAL
ncbi:MAG: hypothetical protein LBS40_06760, partial [Burkholderiales bacterium]|nr:hypothetical protein [Burkholderiales bacterium]